MMAQWCELWIENWVRSNSYPPQLLSNDFYSLLPTYFGSEQVIDILNRMRIDYHRAFPTVETRVEFDDLAWLPPILKADAMAMSMMPIGYLDA